MLKYVIRIFAFLIIINAHMADAAANWKGKRIKDGIDGATTHMVGLRGSNGNLGIGCTEGDGRLWVGVIPVQKESVSSRKVRVDYRFDNSVLRREVWFWENDLALNVKSASAFAEALIAHESLTMKIEDWQPMHFRLDGSDEAIGKIFTSCDLSLDIWPLS